MNNKTRNIILVLIATLLVVVPIVAITDVLNDRTVIGFARDGDNITVLYSDGTSESLGALPEGLQGEQGIQGETGMTGAKGEKGDTGDIGPQGIQGETGMTGAKGEKGDTGDIGPQGIQGIQGERGEQGDTPYIGENGNWWIAGVDTKKQASIGLPVSLANLCYYAEDFNRSNLEAAQEGAYIDLLLTPSHYDKSSKTVYQYFENYIIELYCTSYSFKAGSSYFVGGYIRRISDNGVGTTYVYIVPNVVVQQN